MSRDKKYFMYLFTMASLALCLQYWIKSKKAMETDKNKKYFKLYENWMILLERGDSVKRFFKERNIKEIAVYGYGNIGMHFIEQLSGSDVSIKYVIDRRKGDILTGNIPCCQPSDNIPNVDAIIVTPICEYPQIRDMLKASTAAEIISIEDIIYELI